MNNAVINILQNILKAVSILGVCLKKKNRNYYTRDSYLVLYRSTIVTLTLPKYYYEQDSQMFPLTHQYKQLYILPTKYTRLWHHISPVHRPSNMIVVNTLA